MNLADMSLVITPPLCALAAGTGAAETKMGWASWLFAVGGLAIGVGFGILARRLGLLMLFAGVTQARPIVSFALLMAYMLVPMIVMIGGLYPSGGTR